MKLLNINNGGEQELYEILALRDVGTGEKIKNDVAKIIENVRQNGDEAIRFYADKFKESAPTSLEYTKTEISQAAEKVPAKVRQTLEMAAENIREYHKYQVTKGYEFKRGGRRFGRIVRPLERIGAYIPGGTAAYPSTVLMNCIPAQIAGVEEIIMITPSKDGSLSPIIAAAAKAAGVTRIFAVGGAQGIAALAFGTESIPKVDKIVGPGNIYVAEAKRQLFGVVGIDMVAGPSEVLVIADSDANPEFIAADLLSQLEHDVAAAAILLTDSEKVAKEVIISVEQQLQKLSRTSIASVSAEKYAAALVCNNISEAMRISNNVAPEHLELQCGDAHTWLEQVKNAGSVFIGPYTTEPLGDYFAGTNHVLPTNGSARFSSPLSVEDFVKKFSYLEYDRASFIEDANYTALFADAEGLDAHARAVRIRLEKLGE